MILYLDIETDGLDPTCVWCAVAFTSDAPDTPHVFTYENREALVPFIEACTKCVMHNGIMFDAPVLSRLWGINIPSERIEDTLVLSRLMNAKLDGGHSLEAWGQRLGFPKTVFNDFSHFSPEMQEYCINDVKLLMRVHDFIRHKLAGRGFEKAIACEMNSQFIARDMHVNGFRFDIDAARAMHDELQTTCNELLARIRNEFKPRTVPIREVTPRATRHGTISRVGISSWYRGDDYTQFGVGEPFTLFKWEEFNPSSPKQIVDRLWEAGWKPVNKTRGHMLAEKARDKEAVAKLQRYGWKVDEQNLATLPEDAPESCGLLVEYILTEARRRTLESWMEAYNPLTRRIHGDFNPLGTSTHRCSHSNPNMGNIATAKTIKYNSPRLRDLAIRYGSRMRSMWIADDGAWLVGTDMEGAHLRIFAHLIDDKEFTKALVSGNKKDGTDPHSLNKKKLGDICVDRDRAKTFVFTFLNGGRAPKVAEIFACPFANAKSAIDMFIKSYPGLSKLQKIDIPRDAARGYFTGVDGRLIVNDSEHLMMGMYLQSAESIIMKHANIMWRKILDMAGIVYKQVNWVHDEWVTEVYGTREQAEWVGKVQSMCLARVGERFGYRCPLAGEYKVGHNWLEVH